MGIDLRLIPLSHLDSNNWGYSHTLIDLPRDDLAWEKIIAMKPEMLPVGHAYVSAMPDLGLIVLDWH
jgi:hypothetical protein